MRQKDFIRRAELYSLSKMEPLERQIKELEYQLEGRKGDIRVVKSQLEDYKKAYAEERKETERLRKKIKICSNCQALHELRK